MNLDNQSILITGGTGSFGKKFVETVLAEHRPKRLIVFSRDELKQHDMRQKFPDGPESPMRYFLGDVRDADRLRRAFVDVDIVVHAAALKQVPACEYNPFEAIQTNVIGAKNVIDAAIDRGVKSARDQHRQGGQPGQSLRGFKAVRREIIRARQFLFRRTRHQV